MKSHEYCKLTLNTQSCFSDHKSYTHILNWILDLAWPKYMILTLKQQYMLFVLLSQYHACWCTGDFRSQCISRHGMGTQKPEYSISSITKLKRINVKQGIAINTLWNVLLDKPMEQCGLILVSSEFYNWYISGYVLCHENQHTNDILQISIYYNYECYIRESTCQQTIQITYRYHICR